MAEDSRVPRRTPGTSSAHGSLSASAREDQGDFGVLSDAARRTFIKVQAWPLVGTREKEGGKWTYFTWLFPSAAEMSAQFSPACA